MEISLTELIIGGVSLLLQGSFCIILYLWKKSDKTHDDDKNSNIKTIDQKLNDQKGLILHTHKQIELQIRRSIEIEKQLAVLQERLDRFVTKDECARLREKCMCKILEKD